MPARLASAAGNRRELTLGVGAAAVLLVWQALRYDYLSDDAFIALRYARSWLLGQGLVFNPGERVEGYTSFLWLALTAGLGALGADLVVAARVLGLVLGLALVVLTGWWAYRWARPPRSSWLLAPAFVAANSTFAAWSLAGLETSLFGLLVLISLWAAWREEARRSRVPWSAAAAVLTCLARPEGVLIAAVVFAFKLRRAFSVAPVERAARRGRLALWTAVVGLSLGAYEAWRISYYGSPLPNTYYAKTGGGLAQASRGFDYVHQAVLDTGSLLLLALAAASLLPKQGRSVAQLLAAGALALTVSVVAAGGDGLPLYRFLVPVLAPVALLLSRGLAALMVRLTAGGLTANQGRVAACTVAAGLVLSSFDRPRLSGRYEAYRYQKEVEVPAWSAAGRWLGANAPAGSSIAAVPIGAVSYYSGLPAVDMLGLTDAHIARVTIEGMGTGWAGHEKHDGAYVLSRRPTYLLLGNVNVTKEPMKGDVRMPAAAYLRERDVLANPDFRRLYRFESVKLETGDYFNFYVLEGAGRSSAPAPSP